MNIKIVVIVMVLFVLILPVSASNDIYLKKVDKNNYKIYQKPTNSTKWIEYDLYRTTTSATKKSGIQYVYRLNGAYTVNMCKTRNKMAFFNRSLIVTNGNWEKALRVKTKNHGDVIIGGLHGNEVHTQKMIYISNRLIPDLNAGNIITCSKLKIITESALLDPDNTNKRLAKVITTYQFNGESLATTNKYYWNTNFTLKYMYAAMFPVSNNYSVSSKGQIYGCSVEDLTPNREPIKAHSNGAVLWNTINDLKLSVQVFSINIPKYQSDLVTHIITEPENKYNKVYVTLNSSRFHIPVFNNTVWTIKTRYCIWNGILN